MKTSELIAELHKNINRYGDVDVKIYNVKIDDIFSVTYKDEALNENREVYLLDNPYVCIQ